MSTTRKRASRSSVGSEQKVRRTKEELITAQAERANRKVSTWVQPADSPPVHGGRRHTPERPQVKLENEAETVHKPYYAGESSEAGVEKSSRVKSNRAVEIDWFQNLGIQAGKEPKRPRSTASFSTVSPRKAEALTRSTTPPPPPSPLGDQSGGGGSGGSGGDIFLGHRRRRHGGPSPQGAVAEGSEEAAGAAAQVEAAKAAAGCIVASRARRALKRGLERAAVGLAGCIMALGVVLAAAVFSSHGHGHGEAEALTAAARAWAAWGLTRLAEFGELIGGLALRFLFFMGTTREDAPPFCDYPGEEEEGGGGGGGSGGSLSTLEEATTGYVAGADAAAMIAGAAAGSVAAAAAAGCVPCPAHGVCGGGALTACAGGFRVARAAFSSSTSSSWPSAFFPVPRLFAWGPWGGQGPGGHRWPVGTGACVPTVAARLWAWAAPWLPYLLLAVAAAAWAWRRRRQAQQEAIWTERWLAKAWDFIECQEEPVPLDWLKQTILMDEFGTAAGLARAGRRTAALWGRAVEPELVGDPRLRVGPRKVAGEVTDCVAVLSPRHLRPSSSAAAHRRAAAAAAHGAHGAGDGAGNSRGRVTAAAAAAARVASPLGSSAGKGRAPSSGMPSARIKFGMGSGSSSRSPAPQKRWSILRGLGGGSGAYDPDSPPITSPPRWR